jgi:hypothetical protein
MGFVAKLTDICREYRVSQTFLLPVEATQANHSTPSFTSVKVLINSNHTLPFTIPKGMRAESTPENIANPAVSLSPNGAMIPVPAASDPLEVAEELAQMDSAAGMIYMRSLVLVMISQKESDSFDFR